MSKKSLRVKAIPGLRSQGEGQSGLAETTGDGRGGKPRQIDAKGGNRVYNADHSGVQKGKPRSRPSEAERGCWCSNAY
jgi:hypothetical protein